MMAVLIRRAASGSGRWGSMPKTAPARSTATTKANLRQLYAPGHDLQRHLFCARRQDRLLHRYADATNHARGVGQRKVGLSGAPTCCTSICKAPPFRPDGAVVDASGNLWNAQWGVWARCRIRPARAVPRKLQLSQAANPLAPHLAAKI